MISSRKIVVVGGTGLIGSKVVELLRAGGHDTVVASSRNGIDAYTGKGLEQAMAGADAVIDVSNMVSFDRDVITDFFATSSRNLVEAARRAGVRHHVILSIVNADSLAANPYMAGKLAQEMAVTRSGQAYTIVRATQFYEFINTLVDAYSAHDVVSVPAIEFQPIAATDVAAALALISLEEPKNTTVDLAGPERGTFASFIETYLEASGDRRRTRADADLGYFGAPVTVRSLVPARDFIKGSITLADWLTTGAQRKS
ncbi:NAD(P)H-binding protein [Rhizobium sp. Leaf383]|uniref:SDR family oxidoreductase n=1 Tax=Rhizobium sp. Leaf383 TaxID=1736357 RepID=UPI000713E940|nr:NAD(P)H-binding protein [Rhizobium sp. Leaf383]KQS76382.1 NmrA family transcriptional regulator [Rhizobium sp. Leaf383]